MKIDKAILLSAGLGTRLKPLTLSTPKPLLPIDGSLLIDHQLRYLAKAGIKEVAINLHHLGDRIKTHAGNGERYGLKIFYSEETTLLGTGGGIKKAARLLQAGAFLALNADALQDTDIHALIRHHFKMGAVATMVLKAANGEDYNTVETDDEGMITGFGEGRHYYTGMQIITAEMISVLPPAGEVSCLIKDGYMKLIGKGKKIASFLHTGYFNDLGTPERYNRAREDIARGIYYLEF